MMRVMGLRFPSEGSIQEYDAAVDDNGIVRTGNIMNGQVHKITISIDEYLQGCMQSFDMYYTYDPAAPENESIREHLGMEWHGEVLMMIRWPGLADPYANEDEYGDYDYWTGEYHDAQAYADYEAEIDNGEENTMAAADDIEFGLRDLQDHLSTYSTLLPEDHSCWH